MKIIVYTTTNCPHCAQLKSALADLGHEYEERDMTTAGSMTELKVNGCFALSAPVLQVDDRFLTWGKISPYSDNIDVGLLDLIISDVVNIDEAE